MVSHLLLARPRGFCAGVQRAVDIVDMALASHKPPIYVRGEIVHNRAVLAELRAKGVIFVDEVDQVPSGAVLILSAHGVTPGVRRRALERGLTLIDATCPLVTKVHQEALRFLNEGRTVLLVGHAEHAEIVGILGEAPGEIRLITCLREASLISVPDPRRVAAITQTTLSVDDVHAILAELRRRFPELITPAREDVCYATQNRQSAVKAIAKRADLVLVLGSPNSSNSNRLREVAEIAGVATYLVEDVSQIQPSWFQSTRCVGLTAGASTPEHLVREVAESLRGLGADLVEDVEIATETAVFALPVIA